MGRDGQGERPEVAPGEIAVLEVDSIGWIFRAFGERGRSMVRPDLLRQWVLHRFPG